jgi:hypothetical protein
LTKTIEASIHRSGSGSSGELNRECPSYQGKLFLPQFKFPESEGHLVDATFSHSPRRVSVI